jgi:hypothetical protein
MKAACTHELELIPAERATGLASGRRAPHVPVLSLPRCCAVGGLGSAGSLAALGAARGTAFPTVPLLSGSMKRHASSADLDPDVRAREGGSGAETNGASPCRAGRLLHLPRCQARAMRALPAGLSNNWG